MLVIALDSLTHVGTQVSAHIGELNYCKLTSYCGEFTGWSSRCFCAPVVLHLNASIISFSMVHLTEEE